MATTFANDRLQTESLDTDGLPGAERETTYGYDRTQETLKEVSEDGALQTRTEYTYNLQGRMATVTVTGFESGVASRVERSTYEYNAAGIRVSAKVEIDADADGTFETATRTEYLNDPHNHTGYSQVLVETTTDATGEVQKRVVYTLGHDRLSQTTTTYTAGEPTATETLHFGQDGHGSTRVLFDALGAIATVAGVPQVFHYAAHGTPLGFDPSTAATTFLYSGEQTDATGLQYLRARYYNPATGRFNRLDPFSGDMQDPQSLHKYLYSHADPVMGVDPSGQFLSMALGLMTSINLHLPTVMQGGLVALTLGTIGDVGSEIRNMGLTMLAAGNIDQGLFVYETGGRILNLAMFTAETIYNATQGFFVATSLLNLSRAVVQAFRAIRGGGFTNLLPFHPEHWMDELPSAYGKSPILQWSPTSCGQTCALQLLREEGIESLSRMFSHMGETYAGELAEFLSSNGVSGVRHGNAMIQTVVASVKTGKPAITMTNVNGNNHWVIIDDVVNIDGQQILGIRDPGSGCMGWMNMIDFDMYYFQSIAVWRNQTRSGGIKWLLCLLIRLATIVLGRRSPSSECS